MSYALPGSFLIHDLSPVRIWSITKGANSVAGIDYPSGAPELALVFVTCISEVIFVHVVN